MLSEGIHRFDVTAALRYNFRVLDWKVITPGPNDLSSGGLALCLFFMYTLPHEYGPKKKRIPPRQDFSCCTGVGTKFELISRIIPLGYK